MLIFLINPFLVSSIFSLKKQIDSSLIPFHLFFRVVLYIWISFPLRYIPPLSCYFSQVDSSFGYSFTVAHFTIQSISSYFCVQHILLQRISNFSVLITFVLPFFLQYISYKNVIVFPLFPNYYSLSRPDVTMFLSRFVKFRKYSLVKSTPLPKFPASFSSYLFSCSNNIFFFSILFVPVYFPSLWKT